MHYLNAPYAVLSDIAADRHHVITHWFPAMAAGRFGLTEDSPAELMILDTFATVECILATNRRFRSISPPSTAMSPRG